MAPLQLSLRYIVNWNRKICRAVKIGKCDISRKFSHLKGDLRTMFGQFNRQSGPSPEEANWEGWTPPWMSREGHGPRGPFGPGRGFGGPGRWQGPRGPFGHGRGFGGPWHGWGRHGGPG